MIEINTEQIIVKVKPEHIQQVLGILDQDIAYFRRQALSLGDMTDIEGISPSVGLAKSLAVRELLLSSTTRREDR